MSESLSKKTPNSRLKNQREMHHWTQKFVADRIGISNSSLISKWEHGKSFPRFISRERLCSLFGVSAERLGLLPADDLSRFTEIDKENQNSRLRYFRKMYGWTQAYLASQVGVTISYVRRWEQGKSAPSFACRERLCSLFGESAERLGLLPTDDRTGLSRSIEIDKENQNSRLRYFRKMYGWTQAEVAEKIGAMKLSVGRWERGKILPSPYYQQQLCELYGKNAEELGLIQTEKQQETGEDKLYNGLRYERRLRGLTLKDVSKQIGTYPVNISRWERGETLPSLEFRQRLSLLFGKKLEELGLAEMVETFTSSLSNVI